MKDILIYVASLILVASVFFGYYIGLSQGRDDGARQMARHIFNPAFKTDKFISIVEEEKGNFKGWRVTEDGSVDIYKEGLTFCGNYDGTFTVNEPSDE